MIFIVGGYISSFNFFNKSKLKYFLLLIFVLVTLVSGRQMLYLSICIGQTWRNIKWVSRVDKNGRVRNAVELEHDRPGVVPRGSGAGGKGGAATTGSAWGSSERTEGPLPVPLPGWAWALWLSRSPSLNAP
jgi:hypothetical protein